jgi:hypothetical protein
MVALMELPQKLKKQFIPWTKVLVFLFSTQMIASLSATSVPLNSLQPTHIFSYYLGQDAVPQPASMPIHKGEPSVQALKVATEAEISYSVPVGQTFLKGTIVYRPSPLHVPESDPVTYNPLLIRIRSEQAILFEQAMDGVLPAVTFRVAVKAGSTVTITSTAAFLPGYFYLANAMFIPSPNDTPAKLIVPNEGEGFVDVSPLPRQGVVGYYYAAESIPLLVYFEGNSQTSRVAIRLVPEWRDGQPLDYTFDVPLHPVTAALQVGTVTWKLPDSLGPFKISIRQSVNGRAVFQTERRISVGHQTNLNQVSDSNFGVHVSGTGYPMIYDEFADLWGAKWARIFLRWPVVEYNQGYYDFSRIDMLLDLYRAQHMRILLVLGEDSPSWAGPPGSDYYSAWKRFVTAVAQHMVGKIDAWDVFNEVDAKYYSSIGKREKDWDINALRIALETLKASSPMIPRVCCSTVSTPWLLYNKRLFDSSLLPLIDVASLHPYKIGPPEERDGAFNYLERVAALRSLLQSYSPAKPIWSTEANWIIGLQNPTVQEPLLTEKDQAEYAVRVNLLSAADQVKYFLHSPFSHAYRPISHIATLSAYNAMTSMFPEMSLKLLQSGPQIFEVVSNTSAGQVGAIWSTTGQPTVQLGPGVSIFDMYGNPIRTDPNSLRLSSAPIYFRGNNSTAPKPQIASTSVSQQWKAWSPLSTWTCPSNASCTLSGNARRVVGPAGTSGHLLDSTAGASQPGSCYLVRAQIVLEKGSVAFFAVESPSWKTIGAPVYASYIPDSKPRTITLRFHASSDHFRISFASANYEPVPSAFTVLGDPEITNCQ